MLMAKAKRGKEPKQAGKQESSWSVFRIRSTPAAFVGIVEAPDEASALKKVIEELQHHRSRRTKATYRTEARDIIYSAEKRGRLIKHLDDALALADEMLDGEIGFLIERALDEARSRQFRPVRDKKRKMASGAAREQLALA
jgi:hypothetical protein